MADAQDTTAEVTEEVAAPRESESARYTRIRRESKARAAETVAANAKAAERAKRKAQAKAPATGREEFEKRAKAIEARIAKEHEARQAEGTN